MTQSAAISETAEAAPAGAPSLRFSRGERFATIQIAKRGANSFDPDKRTFTFVLATETPCRSYRAEGWDYVEVDEVLPMRGLEDVDALVGAPILNSHSYWSLGSVLGVITAARIEGKKLVCEGKLSSREAIADIVKDIADGILTKMSVGFERIAETRKDREGDKPLVTVDRWRAVEASVVAVPADTNAIIRSGDTKMPKQTRAADAATETEMTDEEKAKLAAAEAEANATDDTERAGLVEALRSALESVLSGRAAPKAPAAPAAPATPARDAAVEALRGVAKRNGRSDDFEALVTSGAEISELRAIAVSAIRTNSVEIAARSSAPVPGTGAREELTPFSETAAGKRLAARAAATR